MNVVYSYTGVPTIEAFATCNKFIRGLMGPFGSGKSSGCVWELVQMAQEQRPGPDGIKRSRWVVVRNTYKQLEDTTISTVMDWLPPRKFGKYKVTSHEYTITGFKDCHIELWFRALDRPEHVANLLSAEYTGAWLNEAREIPKTIFDAIQGRVGRYPSRRHGGMGRVGIIMDTNPPDDDSWWYEVFEASRNEDRFCTEELENKKKCGKKSYRVFNPHTPYELAYCEEHDRYAIFKQPSGLSEVAENIRNLRTGYYKELAAGKDPEFIRVYIHGEYGSVIEGKPVYPEYQDSVHCKEFDVAKGVVIRRGWDFGLTPSVSFSQFMPSGQWRVIDEYVGDNIAIDKFSDSVISYCNIHYPDFVFEDFGDPAGDSRSQVDERTCFQILRVKGINIEPGEQDPGLRIEAVKKPLNSMIDGEPGLLIHPKCKVLRKGFRGQYRYRRMQTRNEQYTDKPEKNAYSHVHDALQYDATRLFGYRLMTAKKRDEKKSRKPQTSWMAA